MTTVQALAQQLPRFDSTGRTRLLGLLGLLLLLGGCSVPLPPAATPTVPSVPGTPTTPSGQTPAPSVPAPGGVKTSFASDPRSYRRDAAGHLYALNPERIYTGKLPPLLYAIGVMQVELDARGQVSPDGLLPPEK